MKQFVILFGFALWTGSIVPGEAQQPAKAADPGYAGSESCKECHRQSFTRFLNTRKGKLFLSAPRTPLESKGCEACHGPGQDHVEFRRARALFLEEKRAGAVAPEAEFPPATPSPLTPALRFGRSSTLSSHEQNAQCLQCHERGMRLFWKGSSHESRGVTCVTCHQMHQTTTPSAAGSRFLEPLSENRHFTKTTQMEVCFQCHQMRRAQLLRSSHMPFREGLVTCANCHNPHGTPNPKLLTESTVNETCYKCHAERRGPFLWEHPPVMENCLNCHESHGSSHPQLLKARTPRLCQRCHIEARHPTTPQLSTTRFAFNRACTNCHSQIHGSNHPSAVRFHR